MNAVFAMTALCAASIVGASEDINEIRKIQPWNLGNYATFGQSIAVNPTLIVTGAPRADLNGTDSGAAFVHRTSTGQQLLRLSPEDGGQFDEFGYSVAATGQRAIVGAPGEGPSFASSGAVYVFDIQTGEQLHKLTASDADTFDFLGESVGVSGTRIVVGAPGDGDFNLGSAYIFESTTGQQLHKLTASDADTSDFFGNSVAISGTRVVIGSARDDHSGFANVGSAYIFDAVTGEQVRKILPENPAETSYFGGDVAISGDLIAVTASEPGPVGVAYIFDAVSGKQLQRLAPSGPSDFSFNAGSVAINGNLVVIGVRGDDDDGVVSGAAFVFDARSGEEIYRLVASDAGIDDRFADSVAVLGNRAFIGSPTAEAPIGPDSGATYIFDITPCYADVNDDNTVDLADLNIILGNFGDTTTNGDTNFDGVVDLADLNRVLNEFGTDCP